MAKLSIRDIELANKRVFIRVDFNVPLTEDGTTSPTIPALWPRCPPSNTRYGATPRSSWPRTWAVPKASRTPSIRFDRWSTGCAN